MQNTLKSLFNNYYHAFQFPQPQYLGAKYKHLHFIGESLPNNIHSVADAFAGSQSVSYFFKQNGYEVHTNDFLTFSHKIGEALIENHNTSIASDDIKILLQHN
ncbi:MAG: DNA adenine methylase, partial [Helicobacter sp.]|nr:DNA adenine methylase [Helicobacter sp.]